MIDEENKRILGHEVGIKDEAALSSALALLDGEEIPGVEGFGGKLLEELLMESRR